MGVNFFKSINTKIFIFPFAILLIIFSCIGVAAYYFNYPYPAKEFYKLQLISLTKEKSSAVNILLGQYTKAISFISENANIRADLKTIIDFTNPTSKRAVEAKERISKFISEMHTMTDHKMFAIVSRDGIVVYSSREAIIGEDWSEKDIFRKAVLRQTTFVRLTDYKDFDSGIIFLSPIFDFNGELNAFLYVVIDDDRLSGLLKAEDGFYRTVKAYITDINSNIILTDEGIFLSTNEDMALDIDNMYHYFENLKNTPFRLTVAINKAEVEKHLNALIPAYLFFIGFFIAVMIIQGIVSRRLITIPLKKLTNAFESVANGNIQVDLKGKFSGELLELRNAFDMAIKKMSETMKDTSERIFIHEIMSEIKDYAKLIVSESVEIIVEYDDSIKARSVQSGLCIKCVLMTLVNNAAISTDSGIITILASLINEEGIEYLEFSVADTGHGIDGMDGFACQLTDNLLKEITKKSSLFVASGIATAKTLVESIGGRMYIENIQGKGVVSTIEIPILY